MLPWFEFAVGHVRSTLPEASQALGLVPDEDQAPTDVELSDDACRELLAAAAPTLPAIAARYDEAIELSERATDGQIFVGCLPENKQRIARLESRIERAGEVAAAIRSDVLSCVEVYEDMVRLANARLLRLQASRQPGANESTEHERTYLGDESGDPVG